MLEWDGPESCTKTPGFVIINTLFIIALMRDRSEFAQPDLLTIQSLLIQKNPHFVCLTLPISKHFIVSEGVDSGMLVNCCCRSFGGSGYAYTIAT